MGLDLTRLSVLRPILARHGLILSKRFGQNFLVEPVHLQRVADAALIEPGDTVLEIGPGAGVLTRELATRANRVIAIELDRRLLPVLDETVGEFGNVTIVHGDALALDWSTILPTDVTIRAAANIPYNVTSPLLERMLLFRPAFSSIALMVQKEVAQRLRAAPSTPEYGSLSVFAQYHASIKQMGVVPAGAFFPAPKVDSAVVQIIPRPNAFPDLPPERFFAVSRAAFGQRRKTLRNALSGAPNLPESPAQIVDALIAANVDPIRRGETLTLDEIAAIARAIFQDAVKPKAPIDAMDEIDKADDSTIR